MCLSVTKLTNKSYTYNRYNHYSFYVLVLRTKEVLQKKPPFYIHLMNRQRE